MNSRELSDEEISSSISTLSLADRLAEWSSRLELNQIPANVVHTAKRCIIDTTGVIIAGTTSLLPRIVLEHCTEHFACGRSQILGSQEFLSPVAAALVNGAAGHALDFDDTSYTGIMHGSTVVLPAALAAVQHAGGDGKCLLEAFIAGSEVTYAVALQCTTRHYFNGWWSTATFGVFGAAAAAARAMKLSKVQTLNAIAIAGAQANGLKIIFGTDSKPYLAGKAASIGMEAALLAARGVTGSTDVLEGERGFMQLLNNGINQSGGIEGLGKIWRLVEPGIMFKSYPVCSAAHAAVELTHRMMQAHGLSGDDIEQVICEVPPTVAISLIYPDPRSPQQAQFSLPFAIACILTAGTLGISQLTEETLEDPSLKIAMRKVIMKRVDRLHSEEAPECARIRLITRNEHYEAQLDHPTGMPENPMPDEQLHAKFMKSCEIRQMTIGQTQLLLRHILNLQNEKLPMI